LIAKPETAANGTKIAGEGNRDGELITDNSWVMRDLWDTRVTQGRGLVTKPEKLSSLRVKRMMETSMNFSLPWRRKEENDIYEHGIWMV
jgi:hypothetical protein